jgi:hypothetical protein
LNLTVEIHAAAKVKKIRGLEHLFRWHAESVGDFSVSFHHILYKSDGIPPVLPPWIADLIIDYQFPVDYDEANLSSVAARAFLLS